MQINARKLKFSLCCRSIGNIHHDEGSKRHKDASLQTHLLASQKSHRKLRLLSLAENGQRFF